MIKRHLAARKQAGEAGFTLIELLVVIVILAILAAVVVFAVGGVGDKGNEASCVIDTRTLRTALEAHYAQFGDYTVTPTEGQAAGNTAPLAAEEGANSLVSRGFLSERSNLHNARVYDSNGATAGIVPAIEIVVEDGVPPGNDCGGAGGVVGTANTDGTGPTTNR